MLVALLLVPAGCGRSSESRPDPQAPRQEFVISPQMAAGIIGSRTRLFRSMVLGPAASSGEQFPAYRDWLNALASAIRSGGAGAGVAGEIVAEAQAELNPFMPPLPETKDLEKIAAIKQQTRLDSLGEILVAPFRYQSAATRDAAAGELLRTLALGRASAAAPDGGVEEISAAYPPGRRSQSAPIAPASTGASGRCCAANL